MKLPIIFVIDDDAQVLRAITRDLRNRFKADYRIVSTDSATEALAFLEDARAKDEMLALFLSDQRMPEMLGVDFLEKARKIYPDAKRALLTAYSDTEAAIRAINEVRLDYYLMKPWDPPEEKLYPVLEELLSDWQANFKPDFHAIKVVGYQFSSATHAVKSFLAGNMIPYAWLDLEASKEANELFVFNKLTVTELPAIFFEDGTVLKNPSIAELAEKAGKKSRADQTMYDVVIIGAGPAGLAAAVYGASEGLKTLLIEKHAPGGQAGTSSRIENYLGFPTGLSGGELTRRAVAQASRFGAEILAPQTVVDILVKDKYKTLVLADGAEINTLSIIITTGVDYRKLENKGLERFSGAGVYYGAANTEALACKDKTVFVVGGGNSAGQGAMYLSQFASQVYIVIRKPNLTSTMSAYLIEQIANTSNIKVLPFTEIEEAVGDDRLEKVKLKNAETGEISTYETGAIFIFIGAKPFTEWINLDTIKDPKGFIETGRDLMESPEFKKIWRKQRDPFMLETCNPGIFAAGDVRAGAMNRVASAVGEGAMAIKFVHEYLAEK